MVAAVIALGVRQEPESPDAATDYSGFCSALQDIATAALYSRVPPPDAPPELETFVTTLNHELALLRRQIKEACHR